MAAKQTLRTLADLAATALLLPLMACSLAGETAHEWPGPCVCPWAAMR